MQAHAPQQLTVVRALPGAQPLEVWSSRVGAPFVSAAAAESDVAESRGNFHIRDKMAWQCEQQTIEAIEPSSAPGGGVVVRGGFADGRSECEQLRWRLTFSGVSASESPTRSHVGFALSLDGPSARAANRVQLASSLAESAHGVWGTGVQFTHFNLR